MNNKLILAVALVLGSNMAMAECEIPEPPKIPDGSSAAMPDMIAGQKDVKAFQAANIAYMDCVEKLMNESEAAAKKGTDDEKAAAVIVYDKAVTDYNAAVSKEEDVAGQFNKQIGKFKEANPG